MNSRLTEHMRRGATVVTASRRLAQRLLYQYAGQRLAEGLHAWETPRVLPWSAWLQELWADYAARVQAPLLLNNVQQRSLWQNIIRESPYAQRLLQSGAVATQAMDAWALAQQWRLPLFQQGLYLNEDARAFTLWSRTYRARCRREDWVDDAMLAGPLARAVRSGRIAVGGEILLAGFDLLTPQQRELMEALSGAGATVKKADNAPEKSTVSRACFDDASAEIIAAASWARELLARDPDLNFGVVVPDLHARRHEVEAIFDDVLCPGALAAPESAGRPWSLAPGVALAGYAVIGTALEILSLARGPQPLAALGMLLSSPYIKGAQQEAGARARLDAALRRRGEPRVSLRTLVYFAEREHCAVLLEALRALHRRIGELSGTQAAGLWARDFSAMLSLFGWPGERTLDSAEYQCLAAWRDKVLGRLVSLDLLNPGMDLGTAVDEVRRLAMDTAFQPETYETPVQVLGMTGAAAMNFDGLWVMGLHEEVWPPPARPNPFIPLRLQRQRGVPGCSPELALGHARRMTASLAGSAPRVVFSWPANDGDRPLRPSPLLIPFADDPALQSMPRFRSWVERVQGATALERFEDDTGPAVTAGARVAGGAALFADQSACPFRAFAHHRLQARALEETDIGLDARDRGNLVHATLQRFWQSVRNSAALQSLDTEALEQAIASAVDVVLAEAARRRPAVYGDRFQVLERSRLCGLMREWLELEQAREPFQVIACEQKQATRFDGIDLVLRIDRIDRLEDGRELILDYKTGNRLNADAWDGDRPDEPQLPLYAVIAEHAPAALAFAGVRRGKCRFAGRGEQAELMPGVTEDEDWRGRIDQWQQVLSGLAAEFRRGWADVAPKNREVCRTCDLHSLCRIHEMLAPAGDDDES